MPNRFLLSSALLAIAASSSAYAGNDSTFGTVSSTSLSSGDSYAGITLTATDANNGSGGFGSYTEAVTLYDLNEETGQWDVPVTFNIQNEVADFGPAGAEGFGSTLTILAGKASANTTVNLSVRKPNDNEVFGYSTVPPMDNSPGWTGLFSDVFELNGLAGPGTVIDGKTHTDVFAIQISYLDNDNPDPEAYLEDYIYEHGYAKPNTETSLAQKGEIHIAFLDPVTGQYTDAKDSNIGTGSTVVTGYQGSWASFAATYGVTDNNIADFLGSTGVDTATNNAWAIVDHNTTFVAVPEPHSLAIMAVLGIWTMRRRRRA